MIRIELPYKRTLNILGKKLAIYFRKVNNSFPIRLLVFNIQKNYFIILFWLALFAFVTGAFGQKFGIPYLFLDPEYMGEVNFLSFFMLGLGFGAFMMAYNISFYILNGKYFPFLGGVRRPFSRFMLNNGIIPLFFFLIYCSILINFQLENEFQTFGVVLIYLAGLFGGMVVFIGISFLYFFNTDVDVFKLLSISLGKRSGKTSYFKQVRMGENMEWQNIKSDSSQPHVSTYFDNLFSIKRTIEPSRYHVRMLQSILRQNHFNALLIQVIVVTIMIILGFFRENNYLQVPAGASVLIFFSLAIMLYGAFSFWLGSWQTWSLVIVFIFFNFMARYERFDVNNAAYGLNYGTEKANYSIPELQELCSGENYRSDVYETIQILNKWKEKVTKGMLLGMKPKMILISTSGGGHRSGLFTFSTLQSVDSALNGGLFKHTSFISGASGGMMGAVFFRELYLRKVQGEIINPYDRKHRLSIATDLLNPITLSIAVNDIFVPFQFFNDGHYRYCKDRGYAFEQSLNKNVGGILSKRIGDYKLPEEQALIPMMVFSPTIINDGRKLFISPINTSYFNTSFSGFEENNLSSIDGVEFKRFFAKQDADSLRLLSAIRMSASFPFLLPNPSLPSNPIMQVMDAGVRDNFGLENSLRFFYVFKNWISENTSGVIFVQIRDTPVDVEIDKHTAITGLSKAVKPVSGFLGNWEKYQNYQQENLYQYLKSGSGINMDKIVFQYIPSENESEGASISFHLTSREKKDVIRSVDNERNQEALKQLKVLLKEN